MAVRHKVFDTDKHFIIDPVTRTIKNQSGKLVLIQYDHNSERFTFECPRLVDGHDMSLCNSVRIHFINTGTGSAKSNGVYEVDDLRISADDKNNITFSWLVSQNATQHVGKLNFIIRFSCVSEDAVIEYAWNTGIYSDIAISKSIYNGEEFIEDYIDVLEAWKQDLYSEGLKISSVEQTITSTEDGGVNVVTMTMTDGSTIKFQIQNGSPGPSGVSIKSIERTSGNGAPGSTDVYTVTLTDNSTSTFQIYNGSNGAPGSSISNITRTSGNGAPGSKDTYTITLTDGSTTTFQVYNGANGAAGDGSGDMTSAMYDPQAKRTDIFKYVDDAVSGASGKVDVDNELSESSENPVQNKVISAELADKQSNMIGVEILETICENVVFDDNNDSYTLPSAITLDSEALYYMDCYYYDGGIDGSINEKYSIHAFSRLSSGVVRWASHNDGIAITLNGSSITNNWKGSGHTNVISIYKVDISQVSPLLVAALHATGYKTVAPGGYNASAEGHKNLALGYAAHAEGRENYALGDYSHAEGAYSYAYGNISHVEGSGTIASSNYQHVQGKFNVEDNKGVYVHIVGNGESNSNRSNAHTLDWSGNAWFAGNIIGKQANVSEQVRVDNGINSMSIWPNGLAGDPKEDSDESKLWIGSNGEGYFMKLCLIDGDSEKEVATKDDITAAITGAIEGSY